MDPFSKIKFKVKKRCCIYCPVKLIVQILKICFISGQMVQFGKQRSEMVEFIARTDTALKHLVLKDWSATYETMTYPPATGPFAVYTVDDLLDSIQYTWEKVWESIKVEHPSPGDQALPIRETRAASAPRRCWPLYEEFC
ncbi:mucolipin-3-like [Littorina saxatilis]|uniref:mucolipin-3-like n=1 Tax=Littorina saxatilis TaxID=31220 RepID=UPI0038B558DB